MRRISRTKKLRPLAVCALTLGSCLAFAPASAVAEGDLGTEGGLTYVKDSAVLPSGSGEPSASAVAECPGKRNATGGGVAVSGDPGDSYLTNDYQSTGDHWVSGAWHSGSLPDATTTAWVVCSKYKINAVGGIGDTTSGPAEADGEVNCYEGGNAIAGGVYGPYTERWWISSSRPAQGTEDMWSGSLFHRPGTPASSWSISAVCTDHAFDVKHKTVTSDNDTVTVVADCPKKESVAAGGYKQDGGVADSHLLSSKPVDSKDDKGKVPDDGWSVTYSNEGGGMTSFTAYASCV